MSPKFLHGWLTALRPAPVHADGKERLRAAIGAGIGLAIMAFLSHQLGIRLGLTPWVLAPLGASAVLIFAVPGSPMAQPWAVVIGNTLSSAVGTLVVIAMPELDPALAGGLAVCLAILLMMATRSLHPPGGAMALTAVLAHAHTWPYPLFPGMTNSVLLVLAGVAFNKATGRRYPHAQGPAASPPSGQPAPLDPLDEVLRRYNQVLDISRDDLEALLHETERLAYRQRLSELRCENIMSSRLIKVQFGTPLQDAWKLLRLHQIKALPVVDQYDHLVGIVTLADFMRHAEVDSQAALAHRIKQFIKPTPGMHASKPEVVGQIMTRQVRVASAQRPLAELVPLFTRDGHHHIPIVGDKRKLVGIITQSDFLRAWSKAVHEGWQQA